MSYIVFMTLPQNTTTQPITPTNDRLTAALFFANEISISRLREIKKRRARYWTIQRRLEKAQIINDNKPWQRATGPKTAKGKTRASQNAMKHGLYAAHSPLGRVYRTLRAQNTYLRLVAALPRRYQIGGRVLIRNWPRTPINIQNRIMKLEGLFYKLHHLLRQNSDSHIYYSHIDAARDVAVILAERLPKNKQDQTGYLQPAGHGITSDT